MKDLKNYLSIDSTLFSKKLEEKHPLKNLLSKALDAYTVSHKDPNTPDILWPKERYRLEQTPFFTSLDPLVQQNILKKITELNLSLSRYIETSGHNYGAKMILLADSLDEKSIYALFAAEEAIHLREFENFMHFTPDPEVHWHPMLNPLARAIAEGEKNTCLYIIQVLLEGFGMAHYGGLRADCSYAPLKEAYDRILKDEARHHGTGIILSKQNALSSLEKEQIFEYTREFILSLQSANWILNCIEQEAGALSTQEKQKYQEQTKQAEVLQLRLIKMREMLEKVDDYDLVKRLDNEGVFKLKAS
jgi:hypothetical protein